MDEKWDKTGWNGTEKSEKTQAVQENVSAACKEKREEKRTKGARKAEEDEREGSPFSADWFFI